MMSPHASVKWIRQQRLKSKSASTIKYATVGKVQRGDLVLIDYKAADKLRRYAFLPRVLASIRLRLVFNSNRWALTTSPLIFKRLMLLVKNFSLANCSAYSLWLLYRNILITVTREPRKETDHGQYFVSLHRICVTRITPMIMASEPPNMLGPKAPLGTLGWPWAKFS